MSFVHPTWLYAGVVALVALTAMMAWGEHRRRRNLRRFVGDRAAAGAIASLSLARRRIKRLLLLLGVAAGFAALARPLWGHSEQTVQRTGLDLMFAVDTSKSMLTEDLRPNRLARAVAAVEDLAREVGGDRLGLIAFAGDAFLQTPLTLDRSVFLQSLAALDTATIPVGGSDIAAAIRAAEDAFGTEPRHQKILVLLTDGEDLQGDALAAAERAGEQAMTIYAVGIGTPAGELIPIRDERGRPDVVRGPDGEPVRSRLDEDALMAIVGATGGAYQPLGPSGQGLDVLYRSHLASLARGDVQASGARVPTERFQWFLGLALLTLLAELIVGERRREASVRRARVRGPAVVAAIALLMLLGARAARADQRSIEVRYNAAAASYRAGDFDEAASGYEAATAAASLTLQQRAYYDLGNARYRLGQAALDAGDKARTKQRWQAALEAYDGALTLDARDEDAAFNRAFVARKLEQLEDQEEEEEEQEQDQQQDQDQQDQQQDQDQQDQQQGQDQQDPQGQGQDQQDPQGQGQDQQDPQGQGQGQDPQDPQGQGQDQQDPQGQGQGQDPQDPQGQSGQGQSGQGQDSQGQDSREQGQRGQGAAGGAVDEPPGEQEVPGGLTAAEAAQLLDRLEGELRRLPGAYGGAARRPNDSAPRKDW